jgi:hypothetical protein
MCGRFRSSGHVSVISAEREIDVFRGTDAPFDDMRARVRAITTSAMTRIAPWRTCTNGVPKIEIDDVSMSGAQGSYHHAGGSRPTIAH